MDAEAVGEAGLPVRREGGAVEGGVAGAEGCEVEGVPVGPGDVGLDLQGADGAEGVTDAGHLGEVDGEVGAAGADGGDAGGLDVGVAAEVEGEGASVEAPTWCWSLIFHMTLGVTP